MTTRLQKILIQLLLALGPVTVFAGLPPDAQFDRIVTFGDSLSDPGNAYFVTGLQSVAPYAPIPSAPYAVGSNHFSDGLSWIEQFANRSGDPASGGPGFLPGQGFSNFAFGGARARGFGPAPGLATQVGLFLAGNAARPLQDSLFAIWIGANDVRDALIALQTAPPGNSGPALAILQQALQATAANIQALYGAGARSFLVLNVPNLSITPAVRSLGTDATAAAAYLSATYNNELASLIAQLSLLPGISIEQLDVFSLLDDVAALPQRYGLRDAESPCLAFGPVADPVCDDPDEHLFWDALHPTQATHAILADAAFSLIAPLGTAASLRPLCARPPAEEAPLLASSSDIDYACSTT